MKNRTPLHRSALAYFRKASVIKIVSICLVLPGLSTWTSAPTMANPSGGVIVHGNVNIGSGAGGNLQINQASQNAIINWDSFSIGAGELTQFNQPGVNAAVLNRVTGGSITDIQGALQANGNVFVINPNGIVIGATGTVDVHGLVLSTLDVSDGEFLARGDMLFSGNSQAGVTNMGRINAIGGDVFLIGRTIDNAAGATISANNGTVGLAAGQEVLLAAAPNFNGERVFVRATGSGVSGTGILNDGTIEGAAVELKAHGNLYALAINNKGTVRATGVSNYGGSVYLRGMGGSVHNTGTIQATRPGTGSGGRVLIQAAYAKVDGMIKAEGSAGQGGEVRIQGWNGVDIDGSINVGGTGGAGGSVIVEGDVINVGATTSINASGDLGGGSVNIGGGFQGNDGNIANADNVNVASGSQINVDALIAGDGGTAIIWADGNTLFEGDISAQAIGGVGNGGFVEVSGKQHLAFNGMVSTLAANGRNGTLLLDPADIEIRHNSGAAEIGGASVIQRNTLNANLAGGNVVISTTAPGGSDGSIFITDRIDLNQPNSLSLLATGDIVFRSVTGNQARLRNTHGSSGDLILVAGWDGTTDAATGSAASFEASAAAYGNAGTVSTGSIIMDSGAAANNDRIYVGSRQGNNFMFANNLTMSGGADNRGVIFGDWGTTTNDSDIRIKLDGDLTMTGGGGNGAFIQIGHGGDNRRGAANKVGGIDIDMGGALTMTSGGGTRSYTQIGHGGSRSGFDLLQGDISVVTSGNVAMTSGTGGDVGAASQIGHGGRASGDWGPQDDTGDKLGNIEVISNNGGITMTANGRHYVQIGNGGREARSDEMGGNVTVRALGGSFSMQSSLSAGAGNDGYSQIGNGGFAANTAQGLFGKVTLEARDSITVRGGSGNNTFAQVGNGGRNTRAGNTAGHRGDIEVSAGTGISFIAGTYGVAGNNTDGTNYVQLGNGGRDADASANNTLIAGVGHTGDIKVSTTTGDIYFQAGSTAMGSAGLNEGRENYAMLGHGGAAAGGDHGGAIEVEATAGSVIFNGGVDTNDNSTDTYNFALLGHGGAGGHWGNTNSKAGILNATASTAAGNMGLTDGISVTAGNAVSFNAGTGRRSFAQLGLGGYEFRAIDNNDAVTSVRGHDGDITVNAGAGGVNFLAGTGNDHIRAREAYAQLGNGGFETDGGHAGDIRVTVTDGGGVQFIGGSETDNYVQMGHGGRSARAGNFGFDGDIIVNAEGDINFVAGTMNDPNALTNEDGRIYAQLGHGGWDADYSQNGTGQYTGNGFTGDIVVSTTGGSVNVLAGDIDRATLASHGDGWGMGHYAQIGHGGRGANGDHTGDITVNAGGGNVMLAAGGSSVNEWADAGLDARIGHGGRDTAGNHGARDESDVIDVDASGDVIVTAADGINISNAQIGMGGRTARGDHFADIQVNAGGKVQVIGGGNGNLTADSSKSTSYAFGSHDTAGWNATQNMDRAANLGDGGDFNLTHNRVTQGSVVVSIRLDDGTILGTASDSATPGLLVADVNITADFQDGNGTRTINAGDPIGTVTYPANDDGTASVTFNQDVNPGANGGTAGNNNIVGDKGTQNIFIAYQHNDRDGTYAMIGNGGHDADNPNNDTTLGNIGDITVVAGGDVDVIAGSDDEAFAQIGNGGRANMGAHSGDVSVTSGAKVSVLGGRETRTYAQIGNGGEEARGNHEGSTIVDATTGVDVKGGSGNLAYAQIGLGGHEADSVGFNGHDGIVTVTTNTGDINVWATQVTEAAGTGAGDSHRSYGQIGNGGALADGNHTGAVTVEATAGSVDVRGSSIDGVSTGNEAYGQIGNGGVWSRGDHSGEVTVTAGADLNLTSGRRTRGYVQIGNGGYDADNPNNGTGVGASGNITVDVTGNIVGLGGTATNYVQIGNGGGENRGDHSGEITVDADGSISFTGGTQDDAYAQVGHGGRNADGNYDGTIEVTAGDDITFQGGTGNRSYAQLGHGGDENDGNIGSNAVSDIFVHSTGGDIAVRAGSADRAYGSIGHGGWRANFNATGNTITGNIHVGADNGSVTVASGGGGGNVKFAQIGHGGSQARGTKTGDICVHADTGVFATGAAATNTWAESRIGHGGWDADGNASGAVTVVTNSGNIDLIGNSTAANHAFAQIGHGGTDSTGDFSGSISVVNLGGNISVTAGNRAENGAMIGHGSVQGNQTGSRTGGLNVYASGQITMTEAGGNALISHQTSSGVGSLNLAGSGVQANGDSGYSLVAGGGIAFSSRQLSGPGGVISFAEMISAAITAGDVTIASGGTTSDLTLSALDSGGVMATALASYNNANDVTFAAGRHLNVDFSIQNQGIGNVNLIAGWDSNTAGILAAPTMVAPANHMDPITLGTLCLPNFDNAITLPVNCMEIGNNMGLLTIGATTQTVAVNVGSRQGETNAFGYGMVMNAGTAANAETQLGFYGDASGQIDGTIDVNMKQGGITLNSGGAGSFTQIGHGGFNSTSQNITDAADITISFCDTGDVTLNAGTGTDAYAQIGNGGTQTGTTWKRGDVIISNFGNLDMNGGTGDRSYTQVGNGGFNGDGDKRGVVTLTGATAVADRGNITMDGGGTDAYAQIGHGGTDAQQNRRGNVTITNVDDLDMNGGTGARSYTQIGHGGRNSDGNVAGTSHISITLDGQANMDAGAGEEAYTQVGHGGVNAASIVTNQNITLNAQGGGIAMQAGAGVEAYVQIGHGGDTAQRDHSGNIKLDAAGDISVRAGGGDEAYAMIGHGGEDAGTGGTPRTNTGTIDIDTTDGGNLIIAGRTAAGAGADGFAMIGHGGHGSEGTHSGTIDLDIAGGVTLTGGTDTDGGTGDERHVAQIGHGGEGAEGAQSGTISVDAVDDITLTGGSGEKSYSLIGHGGRRNGTSASGSITVNSSAGNVSVTGGTSTTVSGQADESFAQIGHSAHDDIGNTGLAADVISVTGNAVTVQGGGDNETYAKIGNGGSDADGTHLGTINVVARTGNVSVLGGTGTVQDDSFAQIGHGGAGIAGDEVDGNASGNITVTALAGTLRVIAGTRNRSYSQVGHGGYQADGNFGAAADTITVNANAIDIDGGSETDAYAMIGNGGGESGDATTDVLAGNIVINNNAAAGAGAITINGGTGTDTFAKIGHGGNQNVTGGMSGTIDINRAASLTIAGGTGADAAAQIGHGGEAAGGAVTNANIDIDVTGAIDLDGNTAGESFAQIGHGGHNADSVAVTNANITINAAAGTGTGDITLDAGSGPNSYAQIGHGGTDGGTAADRSGNISIARAANVRMGQVNGGGVDAYTQIGHGGDSTDGNFSGTVSVTTAGDVALAGRTGDDAYSQIGHGGRNSNNGTKSDAISVTAGGGVTLDGGSADRTYAQIGHGGENADGNLSGNVTVNSTNTIALTSGSDNDAYTQIGHGGRNQGGTKTGTISATSSAGSVTLLGGTGGSRVYSQIGHGGRSSTGNADGSITVTALAAGQNVSVRGNTAQESFGMIGHGGLSAHGTHGTATDVITVRAHTNIEVVAGNTNNAFAQIGNGGLDTDGTFTVQEIHVEALNGDVDLTAGTAALDDAYAQIGNGGTQATSNSSGIIKVLAVNGAANITAGGGTVGTGGSVNNANYAQVGHGGHENVGNHGAAADLIAVVAGEVNLTAGANGVDEAYAQIGNGGFGSNGNHAGNIQVVATGLGTGSGNITLNGGTGGPEAYATIGHGGTLDGHTAAAPAFTTGTRQGNIQLALPGAFTGTNNSSSTHIHHMTSNAGGILATSNFNITAGTITGANVTDVIQAMAPAGHVEFVATNGDLNVDGNGAFVNTANDIDLVASGDVNFTASVQNAGAGDVNVAAGWDTIAGLMQTINHNNCPPIITQNLDFSQIKGNAAVWGLNSQNINIGDGTQTTALAVGSANGYSNFLGYTLNVIGSDSTAGALAQAGFNEELFNGATGTNGVTTSGIVMVDTKDGGLKVEAGDANDASAQVGHGGKGTNATFGGDIMIDLTHGAAPGALDLDGGAGTDSIAQVGHGGIGSIGDKTSNITIAAASADLNGGSNTNTGALVGNGGISSTGDITGNVSLTTVAGGVNVHGGTGAGSLAQIGNGGPSLTGNSTGNVTVTSATAIDIRSGSGITAAANIGSGGTGVTGTINGSVTATANNGNVNVSAASGGIGSSAQIGNIAGAGSNATINGDVRVDANNGSVFLFGGAGNQAYSQIGNGGAFGDGDFSGEIRVNADQNINMIAPNRAGASYSKIGHGDDMLVPAFAGSGNRDGDIQVGAGDFIVMSDGFVGHVNSATLGSSPTAATSTNSDVYIAPSRNNPAIGTGALVTTPGTEFASSDDGGELRFYFPRRANNQMASGTILNGTSYIGTAVDPTATQRADEFVRNILGVAPSNPLEHDNLDPFYGTNFGAGALANGNANYSVALGNYSLYYDSIELTTPPPPPVPPTPLIIPIFVFIPPPAADPSRHFPDDRFTDDIHQQHYEDLFQFRAFSIWYEGFDHYAREGESIFSFRLGNGLDTRRGTGADFELETPRRLDGLEGDGNFDVRFEGRGVNVGDDEEDILRRQRRQLEEQARERENQ